MTDDIYGEHLDDLLPALLAFRDGMGPAKNGMVTSRATISADGMPAFMRAMMRAGAELLVEEADALVDLATLLTPEQRRHDTLKRLCLATTRSRPV